MLKRLRVEGYKSLRKVEVCFEHLAVLLGPNAAGKSNVLDALQLVSRVVTCKTLKEAFSPPYRGSPLESFTFPPEGIAGLVQSDSATFRVEVDVHLDDPVVRAVETHVRELRGVRDPKGGESRPLGEIVKERDLRYRIELEILPKSGVLRVKEEYLTALNRAGEPSEKRLPFLETQNEKVVLRREGGKHPLHYDRFLDHTVLSLPLYPPHYPHVAALKEELSRWLFFYFEPREHMRAVNPVKAVEHVGLMGEDLAAFLNTLRAVHPGRFRAVERSLRRLIPSITGIEVGPNALGEVELRVLEGSVAYPTRVVSEGTLRLLGLLALEGLGDPPSLVGFEEPENGIHPRRIELVARLLESKASGGTQVIATTHSPILLDWLPESALYVCRRQKDGTNIRLLQDEQGHLFKHNALNERDEEGEQSVSMRLLRGDLDD